MDHVAFLSSKPLGHRSGIPISLAALVISTTSSHPPGNKTRPRNLSALMTVHFAPASFSRAIYLRLVWGDIRR
jgi:hypothetical protein